MAVRFDAAQVPVPWRDQYVGVIRQAINALRPEREDWVVTLYEPADGTELRLDFARGAEARQTLMFALEGDDAEHSGLSHAVSQFLRDNWPDGLRPA
jgi:hypothetical protein